jgi:hypothetical protein
VKSLPLGQEGVKKRASIRLQRPAPPPLLPPGAGKEREEQPRQDERAKEGRRLHEVGVHVMMSESAHNLGQYSMPVYFKAAASAISASACFSSCVRTAYIDWVGAASVDAASDARKLSCP